MPANLTPDYLAAEEDFKSAQTHAEKLTALEKMLSTVPKHKGTEKLQADIKRRLSRLRKDAQKKGGVRTAPFWLVKREGAGQVALVGPPNSGKSRLLAALTNAHPETADYPFTTHAPTPGMMQYEDVQIQLIDLPPIAVEFTERWIPQVIRTADLSLLVVGLDDDAALEEIEFIAAALADRRLSVPRLLVGNKCDTDGAAGILETLKVLYGDRFRYFPVSASTGENLDALRKAVFESLRLVRMYSKPPGHAADMSRPYVLREGQTVLDAACMVHRDFSDHLKFTRLYRSKEETSGRMVDRHHLVADQDILEFHI